MLNHYSSYHGVYVEITKSDHQHGGAGWEFGTCLWSPSRNRSNVDRYALMREPQKGDLILHFFNSEFEKNSKETFLCGYSTVSNPYREEYDTPPSPGAWANLAPYYRIELESYTSFSSPIAFSTIVKDYSLDIRKEIFEDRPKYYPFNTYGDIIRTVQGIYLARCTNRLFNLFIEILKIQIGLAPIKVDPESIHIEYSEAKRLAAERYFFARNSKLVKDAKARYGLVCEVCNFDFGQVYGDLGEGYIEAHHKRPISERPEAEWSEELLSTIEDVTVLCSNCHRMIHRRKPALSIEELREIVQANKTKY